MGIVRVKKVFVAFMLAGAVALGASGVAFSQGKGAGEQGSANGQPFKTVQSHIDLLRSDLEAAVGDLQNQIDDLVVSQAAQDLIIAAIQTAADLLQDRVAENEGDRDTGNPFEKLVGSRVPLPIRHLSINASRYRGWLSNYGLWDWRAPHIGRPSIRKCYTHRTRRQ